MEFFQYNGATTTNSSRFKTILGTLQMAKNITIAIRIRAAVASSRFAIQQEKYLIKHVNKKQFYQKRNTMEHV